VIDEQGVVLAAARGRSARLIVSGRLDDAAVDRLRALLDDVRAPGAVVRVDLSRAATLPLVALRALAAAHRDLRGGARLVLEHPSPAAARALRTSGLHRVLRIDGWPVRPVVAPDVAQA
jgi:anti-anti-sigma regulatory factor